MHIAICDNDARDLKRIGDIMEKYAAMRSRDFQYRMFGDGESLLRAAQAEHFSHYFLDAVMPGMDGLTVAEEIRAFDKEAGIIFLTSFKEYAYQSYRVKAYDYLLKPPQEERIFEILDSLQARADQSGDCICLQSGRGILRIPYVRLSHLEVNQKRLYFHQTDGQVRQISGAMADFENDLLSRPEFIKIHRSYIVNLHQISELAPGECIMFSGKNLPVSRLLYNQVRERYMAHLFNAAEV